MIKLPKEINYKRYNFSVNKKEFIDWFEVLLGDKDISDEIKIETISYIYYRSARYNKINVNNVLRALMACVELSLEWHIDSFEGLNVKKSSEKDKDSLYINRLYLKKLYNEFINFLRYQTPIFSEIEREIYRSVKFGIYEQEKTFDFVCEYFGRSILEYFKGFIYQEDNKRIFDKYVKSFDKESLEAFNLKHRKEDNRLRELFIENEIIIKELITVVENVFCNACHDNTMEFMTSVVSFDVIKSDLENCEEFNKGFGYYHIFNFFSYLQKQDLSHPLKNEELLRLVYRYCNQNSISSEQRFIRFLRNSYFGYQPLFRYVLKIVKNYHKVNLKYSTYDKALCHCLILYKNQDDFKQRMLEKNLWKNLNTVTDNIMHIYYCELDERGTISGYDLRKLLNVEGKLDISLKNVPSLLLWSDDINNYELIDLKEINIENYFEVIKEVVRPIDDYILVTNTSLSRMPREKKRDLFVEAINNARNKVLDIKEKMEDEIMGKKEKKTVIKNYGQLAYSEGSQNVNQTYNGNRSENESVQALAEELILYIKNAHFEDEAQKEDLQEYIEMTAGQIAGGGEPKKSILRTTKRKLEEWSQSLGATNSIVATISNFVNIVSKFMQ